MACNEIENYPPGHFTLFSDSQAALLALTHRVVKSRTVLECMETLNRAAKRHTIELRWIKAHVGYYGNELADEEAKVGTAQLAKSGTILPTKAYFKRHLKLQLSKLWTKQWEQLKECRQTKLFFPAPNDKQTAKILRCDRETLSSLVRLCTGHNFLRRHNKIVNPSTPTSKLCRHCGDEEETGDHVINHCPRFSALRMALAGCSQMEAHKWTSKQLIAFIKNENVKNLEASVEDEFLDSD